MLSGMGPAEGVSVTSGFATLSPNGFHPGGVFLGGVVNSGEGITSTGVE